MRGLLDYAVCLKLHPDQNARVQLILFGDCFLEAERFLDVEVELFSLLVIVPEKMEFGGCPVGLDLGKAAELY